MTSPFEQGVMQFNRDAVLRDYRVGVRSRHASVLGRQEVLTGRAKFGIFGDGKEVAQLAMAYAFRRGDVRSGYYRDQTFMLALGLLEVEEMFAQLYAHADLEAEPAFGGRAMTGHFATRMLDQRGRLRDQISVYNSSADLSPTAAQMPRLVGLAYASKLYREIEGLTRAVPGFSEEGNEVAFGTIGNASCAEGVFWEAVNAIGVLQVPALISIWDDGYGISVPNRYQMTKGNVSEVLQGFQRRAGGPGYDVFTIEGWNYPRLCETYLRAVASCRRDHVPVILHVCELTQPLGHSTSGSHERYKSPERLAWERDYDCLRKMRDWMVEEGIASSDQLDAIDEEEKILVRQARDRALEAYRDPIAREKAELLGLLREVAAGAPEVAAVAEALERRGSALRRDLAIASHRALVASRGARVPARGRLAAWRRELLEQSARRYGSDLYSEGEESALRVSRIEPVYGADPVELNGFEILNACFDAAFARDPRVIAMGEDVGQLGDVNQGLAHLQQKYGELRVSDTGIREATILGQAIGLALRGLRPIAEIQYLDYVLYALQIMSDDLATLRWRTRGGQKAPVIIRTRGHRLEGIWHSGSPMGGILHLCRGIYVCVPRDATRAAGFYNTLLRSDDTGMIVEVLNGYRRKEPLPSNIDQLTVPLGVPEVLRAGRDATIVTYGALCPIALDAAADLTELGIEAEVIDVQTLLPFDREGVIVESLRRTNRILFLDEDVPGGASAFMLREVLERQRGYEWLDAQPRTLTAAEHRPPYGSDGDYFSKPQREDIVEAVYELMREGDPRRFPALG
ncbi:MAG TPA: thiamine pyrophosphate-dependent enzyme [Thermoanaerobaculia bacterium]|nr:thiamine pyrophosphate-dependent enzyme [Thermoanaerobaculia bacterium]